MIMKPIPAATATLMCFGDAAQMFCGLSVPTVREQIFAHSQRLSRVWGITSHQNVPNSSPRRASYSYSALGHFGAIFESHVCLIRWDYATWDF